MPAYSITSAGLIPSMLWALLLLAASLNAQNQSWDRLKCTEPKMSVPRGSRVLMACNILNTFQYITIEWTAYRKTTTIFNKMSPGNYRKDAWQLQIQGGWAQLVITDAQDTHTGQYLWLLRGLQKNIISFTLNVTEPQDQEEAGVQELLTSSHSQATDNPEPSAVRWEVVITVGSIIIILFTGFVALARYKQRHSLKCRRALILRLSQGSPPYSTYLPLP